LWGLFFSYLYDHTIAPIINWVKAGSMAIDVSGVLRFLLINGVTILAGLTTGVAIYVDRRGESLPILLLPLGIAVSLAVRSALYAPGVRLETLKGAFLRKARIGYCCVPIGLMLGIFGLGR
jgi:hypothetical protein